MRYLIIKFFLLIFSSCLFVPQLGFSSEEGNANLEATIASFEKNYEPGNDEQTGKKVDPNVKKQNRKETRTSISRPVYKPPLRGAPVGRIAGGTRGILDEYPSELFVITPDHISATISDQPVFYWYLRKLTSHPVEFTLIEEQAISPTLEIQIPSPEKAGFQTLHLADYNIRLKEDQVYKWFIALIPDKERRSKDILAWSAVKYNKIPDQLKSRLSKFDDITVINIFAAAGIWYDAFAELSGLIEASPNDSDLRVKREALLEQIGLNKI